jgi:hypothetical protein
MMAATGPADLALRGELNRQAGRIHWAELERHFARGSVVWVAPELDLIEVAVLLVRDRQRATENLVAEGKLVRATDDHARDWISRDPDLWAVVAAPWVLVQEKAG